MRNMRKRRDRDVPCVMNSRAKRAAVLAGPAGTGIAVRPKSSPAFGLPNYHPLKPDTEDDASTMKHRELLMKESSKTQWNARVVDASMKLTFYDRRVRIVENGQSIQTIKETYPCLFDCHQVRDLRCTGLQINQDMLS